MIRHLQRHGININEPKTGPSQPGTSGKRVVQQTLEEVIAKVRKYDANGPVAHSISVKIAEMIATDYLPYSIVENIGFRRLLAEIIPRYSIPSRKYFTQKVIPGIYEKIKLQLKEKLSRSAGPVCATTDVWTSSQNICYMSLTAHTITWDHGDLKPASMILACSEFEGPHTAQAILNEIRKQECEWGIRLHAVVSDNAANVVKALSDGDYLNIRCVAHTLNLIVQHGLEYGQSEVRNVVADSRKIVSHFHRSARNTGKLKQYQLDHGLPSHQLIADVQTRWNSTYLLQRLVEQKQAINFLATNEGIGKTLTFNDWEIASSLVTILETFDVATREISSEQATLAHVLPLTSTITKALDSKYEEGSFYHVRGFLSDLREQIKRRFAKPENGIARRRDAYFQSVAVYKACTLAAILDPRLKLAWAEMGQRETLSSLLESEALACFEACPLSNAATPVNEEASSSSDDQEEPFGMLFQSLAQSGDTSETHDGDTFSLSEQVRIHVSQYLSSPLAKRTKTPMDLWVKYRNDCPALFKLAMMHLACPPTSVCSERLFSDAGIIVSPLRNKLKPKNVETLTFLHVDLRKLNFRY